MVGILSWLLLVACSGAAPKKKISIPAITAHKEQVVAADKRIIGTVVTPGSGKLKMYWKNPEGKRYGSLGQLRDQLISRGDALTFATNGGMYRSNHSPVGLYVEGGRLLSPLDTASGKSGNFYMLPNGVFALADDGQPSIVPTDSFRLIPRVKYATQSGPLLLIDGEMHPAFRQGSPNLNIRNGVGIMGNGKLLFAMSRRKINFYDFADYFRKNGCRNALYLDGFVSRTYAPEQGLEDAGGDFGVMIGVVEKGMR